MSNPARHSALLIIGAMGTGKSHTSYHIFSRLFRAGIPTARIDLDDVGMCHPAPEGDPDNNAVKAEAMAAAWGVFERHGAGHFVVSGGMNSQEVIQQHTNQIPEVDWTIVRLRIGTEERRRRVVARGALLGYTEAEMGPTVEAGDEDERIAEGLHLPGLVVDTDGLTPKQVTDLVLTRAAWPSADAAGNLTREAHL